MGNEWLIPVSLIAVLPILGLFAFLIRGRSSRNYALTVFVLCVIAGLDGMRGNGGWDYWAIRFTIAFCVSAVVLGLIAWLVAGIVHLIRGNKA